MDDGDLDDDVWDKVGGDAEPEPEAEIEVEVGPPIRVTFVIAATTVPVAPWAQGWRVGTIGPDKGQVMLVCEHDVEISPVAQLSAITGLLGTIKAANLDLVWWAIQTRGPLQGDPGAGSSDLDAEFSDLLGGAIPDPPPPEP